ncbi:MAG TPA: GYF domain-containing protein [Verrucomicrobiae bacterium]|jgi:hypothetical protein
MTYTIIGGDGKEYGFISPEDIRKWVAENRLNAQSLVKAEGDAEFRPLSTFPEFADAFAPPPLRAGAPPLSSLGGTDGGRARALQMVKGPAIALIVTAALGLLLTLWGLVQRLFMHSNMDQFNQAMQQVNGSNPQMAQFMQKMMDFAYGPWGMVNSLFALVTLIFLLIGAIKMNSLRSYELAVTAAILAMIPCVTSCCCILGLPFGIWALVVLMKPEVKSHFN